MADNSVSDLFDMSEFTSMLDGVQTAVNREVTAKKELAEKTLIQQQVVTKDAADYSAEASKTLDVLKKIQGQGEEARAMAESDNIFDRISLIGAQMLKPGAYTAAGREKRLTETSQQLALRGQIHNVNVNLAQAKVAEATAEANIASIDREGRQLALKTQLDGLQLVQQSVAAVESLRAVGLSKMELPQIQQALAGPAKGGKYTIDGMVYTPLELQERARQLETRQKLIALPLQAADPEYGQRLQIKHDLELQTYTQTELEQLRANGYIMPDGTQVNSAVWDTHYQRQLTMQQAQIERTLNREMIHHQLPIMLEEDYKIIQNGEKYITPGSPLSAAKRVFQSEMGMVAKLAETDNSDQGKLVQFQKLGQSRDKYFKEVEKEATRKAAGDKELAGIYFDQFIGNPVSAAKIEEVTRSRYIAGKGFADYLPTELSSKLTKSADVEFQRLQQENAQAELSLGIKKSTKELREEAINRTMEKEAYNYGVQGLNDVTLRATQRTDNPARLAGMAPDSILIVGQRAAAMTDKAIKDRYGLSEESLLAIKDGRFADAQLPDGKAGIIAQEYNASTMAFEYDLFEAERPGLGYKMQQWYAKELPDMARKYTESLDPMVQAITGDAVLDQAQRFNALYANVDEMASQRGRDRIMEMQAYAQRPENSFILYMQMSKNLNDAQKSELWSKVIQPTLAQAKANNASVEQATAMTLDAIAKFKTDDAILGSAIRQFQRELPDTIQSGQDALATMMKLNYAAKGEGSYKEIAPWLPQSSLESLQPPPRSRGPSLGTVWDTRQAPVPINPWEGGGSPISDALGIPQSGR